MQPAVALESRVGAPDLVDASDEILQAARRIEVPAPELVLLRIQVLFACRLARRIHAQLECRAVDSIICAQGCRQSQTDHKGGAASGLQKLMKDVRRVRPKIRAKILTNRRPCQLAKIVGEFLLRVAPREICVGLRESELGQAVHHVGTRERLGEEEHVGMIFLDLRNRPLPE